MKKELFLELLDSVFIPLITYLLAGLLTICLGGLSVNSTFFVMWGILAGLFCAIQKYFSNRMVTIGISMYAVIMILWFAFFTKDGGRVHAVMILLGFAAVFFLRFLMKWRMVKVISGFLGLLTMIYCVILGGEFSKGIVFLALVLFLNAISELIAFFYDGNAKSLILIYVLIAALTLFMPSGQEPYGWDFVFRIIHSVEEIVDKIATEIQYQMMDSKMEGIFHFQTTGYSDAQSGISQSIWEQDMEQLILYGDYTKRNLYLKGNVSGKYTPDGFQNEEDFLVPDYRIDTLMTLYSIFRETDDIRELRKFMEIKKQEITLRNIKTESLFYPVKLLSISAEGFLQDGDNLRAGTKNGRGYTYSYCFVDLDYSNEFLVEIIKNSRNIIYEEREYYHVYDVLEKNYGITIPQIPFEDFVKMAETYDTDMQRYYQGEESEASERISLLAGELVLECENDYDCCRALEQYLYQYHYNQAVSIPKDADVLEYFLFEGKEGYCVHYATALAVMLRCRNIPARVAEGFLVDYKNRLDSYTYSISSNKAHAWVEAYLEGFGWIRLEPTVVNASDANAVWYAKNDDTEEVWEEENESDDFEEEAEEEERKEEQRQSWFLMIKLFGGMLGIVGMILVILYFHHKISVQRSSNPDIVCHHLIAVLERKYAVRRESESIREYFERILELDNIPETLKNELPVVKSNMEEYWYGNGTVREEDIVQMKRLIRGE